MNEASGVSGHYTSCELLARLEARLRDDGVDPAHPTFEALVPYDHFHGRGLEATEDMANLLQISGTDHILDVGSGSGIGGPARYFARRFGCRVSGIDLTAEFCDVARHLTSLLGLDGRVSIEQGDALAMPFDDTAFDKEKSHQMIVVAARRSGADALHTFDRQAAQLRGAALLPESSS